MTNYAEVISANIRAERARLGMSQASAAEGMRAYGFTNWQRPTLAKIEHGQRQILAAEVLTLADVFGIPVMRLLSPVC